jgi:hypothetical protein
MKDMKKKWKDIRVGVGVIEIVMVLISFLSILTHPTIILARLVLTIWLRMVLVGFWAYGIYDDNKLNHLNNAESKNVESKNIEN